MIPEKERNEQSENLGRLSQGAFNPELLRVGRVARGFSQTDLAGRVGVKQVSISRWEDGLRTPDVEEVLKISIALGRTVDFFYQSDRLCGVETSFMFRRRQRTPVALVKQIESRINIVLMSLRRTLRAIESWPVRFENMDIEDEKYEDAEQIARLTRAAWQLPFGPIPNLVAIVESAGGIVFPFDFGSDDVDAVGIWPWDMPPIFFLNPSAPADRSRFNLAHEIGHVIMHRYPTPNMEDEADGFASELLLPQRDVASEFANLTFQKALRLKLRWRASAQAIIRKAHKIGAISDGQYKSMNVFISKKKYRKVEPNPIAPEQPTTLDRLVKGMHLQQLGYQVSELASITFYRDVDEFRREFLRDSAGNPFRVVG